MLRQRWRRVALLLGVTLAVAAVVAGVDLWQASGEMDAAEHYVEMARRYKR